MSPDELGVTSTHEHLFIDAVDAWYEPPEAAYERAVASEPVSMDNLWYTRRNPMQHEDNLRLNSMEEAIDEVSHFARAGGDTIVDVTPNNIGRDPKRVRAVARETGLNFVHGTAYYTQPAHPDRFASLSPAELEEKAEAEFVSDVRDGIGETDVRAGIVGEIGLSNHIHPDEEAILRAGARAARRTGAALTIHPPGRTKKSQKDRTMPTSRWGLEVLDIVEAEGLAPERVIIDHMDRTIYEDLEYQKELAERGATLEYDVWGLEAYLDDFDDAYPSDSWRVDAVCELLEAGHGSNLVFGHDVYIKIQRRKYGGFGYGHILENVVPMLKSRGVDDETITQILVENPKEILTFVEPEE
ncbi:phosphotriesterase family protein [Salinirarus marinus]|uniref:phosphotriesterase family protein n=1 Tax=Salinirarus marinus TaxID=3068310 RepID=UPI003C6BF743